MNSKTVAAIIVVAAAVFAPLVSRSQQPERTDQKKTTTTTKAAEPSAKDAGPRATEIAELQATAQAFVEAFNHGDAKAVAALWTKDGEYIDESGQRFEGRDAIEKEYASFFAAHPAAKVNVVLDSFRLASDTTAIEDGRALVQLDPNRSGEYGRYTAVHVKADGKWLMSSVRDRASSRPVRQVTCTTLGGWSGPGPLKRAVQRWTSFADGSREIVFWRGRTPSNGASGW